MAGWTLVAISLLVLFADVIGDMVLSATTPFLINDDVRQHISPLFRCVDGGLFPGDVITDYYNRALHPLFFKGFYCLLARMGLDPATTSALLPALTLALTILFLGWAAYRLAGMPAAWATIALTLGSSDFPERMAGGLQRGFAFPILAIASACLVTGRIRGLAVIVVLGAGLYPPAALVAGGALAMAALLPSAEIRGDLGGWTMRMRIALVLAVASLSFLVVAPTIIAGSKWGPQLSPARHAEYPEAGPGGRYSGEDQFGSWVSLLDMGETVVRSVRGTSVPWAENSNGTVAVVLIVSLVCWLILMRTSDGAVRLTLLPIAGIVCAVMSVLLVPVFFIPQRFIAYPLPTFVMIMLGTAVPALVARQTAHQVRRMTATAGVSILVVLLAGGRGNGMSGYTVDFSADAPLLNVIGALPKDSLIAGWPGGVIDLVPWASRRSALITRESHVVFHEKYVLEMRSRMAALIDSFYSSNEGALERLRDTWGVDFLIVEPRLVYDSADYFTPFDQWIASARDELGTRTPAALNVDSRAIVYRDGERMVLDLHRLP